MNVQDLSIGKFRQRVQERTSREASKIWRILETLLQDTGAKVGIGILVLFTALGLFGPYLAPHDPIEHTMRSDSSILRLTPPSQAAPLGTTSYGKDIFSQFLTGARPTFLVGLFGGIGTGLLGFLVGLVSGYFGGRVDEFLMRMTDLTFALPLLPMALLILSFVQPSTTIIIVVLVAFIWKVPARVIRAEVLTIRERTFVKSARASGAGHARTMFLHVAPNVVPVAFLYMAYAVAWSITGQATLAFLGFGDPTTTSWGRMLRQVFESGSMREAWWWVLPPAIGIMLVTTSVFLVGRAFEEVINPDIQIESQIGDNE